MTCFCCISPQVCNKDGLHLVAVDLLKIASWSTPLPPTYPHHEFKWCLCRGGGSILVHSAILKHDVTKINLHSIFYKHINFPSKPLLSTNCALKNAKAFMCLEIWPNPLRVFITCINWNAEGKQVLFRNVNSIKQNIQNNSHRLFQRNYHIEYKCKIINFNESREFYNIKYIRCYCRV